MTLNYPISDAGLNKSSIVLLRNTLKSTSFFNIARDGKQKSNRDNHPNFRGCKWL
jgi:hypothetical protein